MREELDAFARQIADRYRLQDAIGEGGMATVYLAHDERHGRSVVVKVMRPDLVSADASRRFLREIQITAKLSHPNILPLIDSGIADGISYYVVPLVTGGSLRNRIDREGALPLDVVRQITRDIAGALDRAHAQGVIHRDIKPENVLLENGRAIVADFGIARAIDEVSAERLTATGLALGTPAYMSPEQTDSTHIDGRSDLYSLGCVLYEMLTGHAPFSGSTPQEVLARHAVDPVPSVRSARPNLPPQLEHVIATALAKAPADRYQSGAALLAALESVIDGTSPGPRRRRRRGPVTALIIAGIAAASLLVWKSSGQAAFQNRDWIVVGDLTGDPADSALHRALRDAFLLALRQSRYVNVKPPSAISEAIRMMGRPDTTRLTEGVAREVAMRQGARAVLLPSFTRLDSTYLFTARVLSPQNGSPIIAVRERATSRAEVLDALDRLAVDVRTQLGEHLQDAEPAVPLGRATTQSLDALRAWTLGNGHFREGRYDVARDEYSRALSLDSNFAMAHKSLGATLYWTNRRDSGDKHFQRALALGDRLTEREHLLIRAEVANWRKQSAAAIGLYQQFLLQYPDDIGAKHGFGFVLMTADRCNEALEPFLWLRSQDSTDLNARINLATCYVKLRRYPEALTEYRAAFALRPQWARSPANIVLEYGTALIATERFVSAESLYRVQLEGDAASRARAHRSLALLSVYRGQNAAAREYLRQAITEDVASSGATSTLRDRMYLIRALLDVGKLDSARLVLNDAVQFSRKQTLDPPWIAILGELAARVGDNGASREMEKRVAAGVQEANSEDQSDLHWIRGNIALADGDLAVARAHFDTSLAARRTPQALFGAARTALAQGRQQDAAARFTDIVDLGAFMSETLPGYFAARLELGRLAATRGDTTAARQHLGWIMTQWAKGDTDVVVRRAAAASLASLDASRRR